MIERTLHVTEGEKCADALIALGLLATTSQGGAGRAAETDWTPAARFARVVLWQDCDGPGEKFVRDAAELITGSQQQTEAARGTPEKAGETPTLQLPAIEIVDLRAAGLAEGQDVYDLLAAWRAEGKDDEACVEGLKHAVQQYGHAYVSVGIGPALPEQPAPLGPAPVGLDGRPELRNYELVPHEESDGQGGTKTRYRPRALTIDAIRGRLLSAEIAAGWPCRVRAPGAKTPLLFVVGRTERAGGAAAPTKEAREARNPSCSSSVGKTIGDGETGVRVRWLGSSEQFKAWVHETVRLKFKDKADGETANFVTVGDVYQSLGGGDHVGEYVAVEIRPHFPALRGHYYTWDYGAEYCGGRAPGDVIKEWLSFFPNTKDQTGQVLLAAALMTPGWGGPYKARPAFNVTAPDRGYGKTTIAEMIATVWGGHLAINLQGRDEDELLQRLLTPEALTKRVGLVDNVKGTLSSALLEGLITCETISGKRLYSGEAVRPNTMTYLITGNGMRLSRDMALRSYIIELTKPQYDVAWERRLADFIRVQWRAVVADVGRVLSMAPRSRVQDVDRWPDWQRDVLARACDLLRVDPASVMQTTKVLRDDCDDDLEEAGILMAAILQAVCEREKLLVETYEFESKAEQLSVRARSYWTTAPVWIASREVLAVWGESMNKKMGAKQVYAIVRGHAEAGRLRALRADHRSDGNGYWIANEAIAEFLETKAKELGQVV